MTRARARFAVLEDIMRKLLTALFVSFVLAAPAAQANDLRDFFGGFHSNSRSDNPRIKQLQRQKSADKKLLRARGDVAEKCSRSSLNNYYDCEIAQEKLRDAQYEANMANSGLDQVFGDRRAYIGRQSRSSNYEREFRAGMAIGNALGERLQQQPRYREVPQYRDTRQLMCGNGVTTNCMEGYAR